VPLFTTDEGVHVKTRASVCVVAVLLAPDASVAHHSNAMFDMQKTITLRGVVKRYEWTNPHVYVYLETGLDGESAIWEVEGGSPTMMERFGWFADSLHPGDRLTVEANPARNASRRMAYAASMRKADGVALNVHGTPSTSADPITVVPATTLSGNWLPTAPSHLPFLLPPTAWELTEEGRLVMAGFSETQSEGLNCVSLPAPFVMVWPDLKQIELRDEVAIIRVALIDDVERVVHIGVDSHEGGDVSNQGHSIGRWEGPILVVDTTNFAPHSSGNRAGLISTSRKHLVERFELSSDGTHLTYSYVLEDPEYLARPFAGSSVWVHRPDLTYTAYDCDLANARRYVDP
jgi:hypothetical protein